MTVDGEAPADLETRRTRVADELGFREDGTLPPYLGTRAHITDPVLGSPFALSVADAVDLLGFTATRRRLLGRLLDYRAALREIGIDAGVQWIGGSFAERQGSDPHDVDVVTLAEVPRAWAGPDARALPERRRFDELTTPKSAKAEFSIDAYFYPLNDVRRVLPHIAGMLSLLSHTKANTWKGFVQLELDDDDDGARARLASTQDASPPTYETTDELVAAAGRDEGAPRLLAYETTAMSPFSIRPGRSADTVAARRCLPIRIADAWGWDITLHEPFEVVWYGGDAPGDVKVTGGGRVLRFVGSRFGHGIVTIRLPFVFRTPRGWNLWVRGPSNRPRDGIAPLEGMVETDWSVAPFSLNWQLTRSRHVVRFEAGDIVGRLVPVRRHELEAFDPVVMPIGGDKGLARRVRAWSRQRGVDSTRGSPGAGEYAKGEFSAENTRATDHQLRLRLARFRRIE